MRGGSISCHGCAGNYLDENLSGGEEYETLPTYEWTGERDGLTIFFEDMAGGGKGD